MRAGRDVEHADVRGSVATRKRDTVFGGARVRDLPAVGRPIELIGRRATGRVEWRGLEGLGEHPQAAVRQPDGEPGRERERVAVRRPRREPHSTPRRGKARPTGDDNAILGTVFVVRDQSRPETSLRDRRKTRSKNRRSQHQQHGGAPRARRLQEPKVVVASKLFRGCRITPMLLGLSPTQPYPTSRAHRPESGGTVGRGGQLRNGSADPSLRPAEQIVGERKSPRALR
jgi:hypothetical protein